MTVKFTNIKILLKADHSIVSRNTFRLPLGRLNQLSLTWMVLATQCYGRSEDPTCADLQR